MSPMRDEQPNKRTTEDRATQPVEAGGWVSQFFALKVFLADASLFTSALWYWSQMYVDKGDANVKSLMEKLTFGVLESGENRGEGITNKFAYYWTSLIMITRATIMNIGFRKWLYSSQNWMKRALINKIFPQLWCTSYQRGGSTHLGSTFLTYFNFETFSQKSDKSVWSFHEFCLELQTKGQICSRGWTRKITADSIS